MTIGSLFSGVGGLELGLERAGLGPVLWQCEIDPFCRAVLAKHWPDARRYVDVREVSGAALPVADVICGGSPCQDLSAAGKRAGLNGERSGLWFEFARIVEEARPRVVVFENVRGLLGRALGTVAGRLAELGYAVEATRIRAADVGAPHLRERVFLVAVADGDGERSRRWPTGAGREAWREASGGDGVAVGVGHTIRVQPGRIGGQGGPDAAESGWSSDGVGLADSHRLGLEVAQHVGAPYEQPAAARAVRGRASAAESGVGERADGLPGGLAGPGPGGAWPAGRGAPQRAWEPPRTLAGVANRPAQLRALGNAVVPQCGYVVGLRVLERLGRRA